ncbi:centrosome-associated protein 350 isoform X3 [Hydra vulgaris]|uniref:centrosome-associated protein 350 isoform X3 n=1 Tax=Hydra vulgaris TaxID=6087 RepID=UPI001F5F30E1|nr:centrosome-associated protein 350 isoform X2 [Hydra vulgaris]
MSHFKGRKINEPSLHIENVYGSSLTALSDAWASVAEAKKELKNVDSRIRQSTVHPLTWHPYKNVNDSNAEKTYHKENIPPVSYPKPACVESYGSDLLESSAYTTCSRHPSIEHQKTSNLHNDLEENNEKFSVSLTGKSLLTKQSKSVALSRLKEKINLQKQQLSSFDDSSEKYFPNKLYHNEGEAVKRSEEPETLKIITRKVGQAPSAPVYPGFNEPSSINVIDEIKKSSVSGNEARKKTQKEIVKKLSPKNQVKAKCKGKPHRIIAPKKSTNTITTMSWRLGQEIQRKICQEFHSVKDSQTNCELTNTMKSASITHNAAKSDSATNNTLKSDSRTNNTAKSNSITNSTSKSDSNNTAKSNSITNSTSKSDTVTHNESPKSHEDHDSSAISNEIITDQNNEKGDKEENVISNNDGDITLKEQSIDSDVEGGELEKDINHLLESKLLTKNAKEILQNVNPFEKDVSIPFKKKQITATIDTGLKKRLLAKSPPVKRKLEDENYPKTKVRHYDQEEVKRYMLMQQNQRKKQLQEEKRKEKEKKALQDKMLQELYAKQKAAVRVESKHPISETFIKSKQRKLESMLQNEQEKYKSSIHCEQEKYKSNTHNDQEKFMSGIQNEQEKFMSGIQNEQEKYKSSMQAQSSSSADVSLFTVPKQTSSPCGKSSLDTNSSRSLVNEAKDSMSVYESSINLVYTKSGLEKSKVDRINAIRTTAAALRQRLDEEAMRLTSLVQKKQTIESTSIKSVHYDITENEIPGVQNLEEKSRLVKKKNEMEDAAKLIQAAYRGHCVRQSLSWQLPSGRTLYQSLEEAKRQAFLNDIQSNPVELTSSNFRPVVLPNKYEYSNSFRTEDSSSLAKDALQSLSLPNDKSLQETIPSDSLNSVIKESYSEKQPDSYERYTAASNSEQSTDMESNNIHSDEQIKRLRNILEKHKDTYRDKYSIINIFTRNYAGFKSLKSAGEAQQVDYTPLNTESDSSTLSKHSKHVSTVQSSTDSEAGISTDQKNILSSKKGEESKLPSYLESNREKPQEKLEICDLSDHSEKLFSPLSRSSEPNLMPKTIPDEASDYSSDTSNSIVDELFSDEINPILTSTRRFPNKKLDNTHEIFLKQNINQFRGRMSPNTLERRLRAEINLFDNVGDTMQQVDEMEKVQNIINAQQQSVALAQVLKSRQLTYKHDLEKLSMEAKEKAMISAKDIESARLATAEASMKALQMMADIKLKAADEATENAKKIVQVHENTTAIVLDAANKVDKSRNDISEAYRISVERQLHDVEKVAVAAASAASVAAVNAALEHHKQQLERLRMQSLAKISKLYSPPDSASSIVSNKMKPTDATVIDSVSQTKNSHENRTTSASRSQMNSYDTSKMLEGSLSQTKTLTKENSRTSSKFSNRLKDSISFVDSVAANSIYSNAVLNKIDNVTSKIYDDSFNIDNVTNDDSFISSKLIVDEEVDEKSEKSIAEELFLNELVSQASSLESHGSSVKSQASSVKSQASSVKSQTSSVKLQASSGISQASSVKFKKMISSSANINEERDKMISIDTNDNEDKSFSNISFSSHIAEEFQNENESIRLGEHFNSSLTENELKNDFRMVLPSENHRRKSLDSNNIISTNEQSSSDDIKTPKNNKRPRRHSKSPFAEEDTFSRFTVDMVCQYIQEEEMRAKHQKALLALREKAIIEKTKAEMAFLEMKKKSFKKKGSDDMMPPITKKQRALLMKLQAEQAEIRRQKETLKVAKHERKSMLNQQREIQRIRSSTQIIWNKLGGLDKNNLSLKEDVCESENYKTIDSSVSSSSRPIVKESDLTNALSDENNKLSSCLTTVGVEVNKDHMSNHETSGEDKSSFSQDLKKLRNITSERYLTEREKKLQLRKDQFSKILERENKLKSWREKIIEEEQKLKAEIKRVLYTDERNNFDKNVSVTASQLLSTQTNSKSSYKTSSPNKQVDVASSIASLVLEHHTSADSVSPISESLSLEKRSQQTSSGDASSQVVVKSISQESKSLIISNKSPYYDDGSFKENLLTETLKAHLITSDIKTEEILSHCNVSIEKKSKKVTKSSMSSKVLHQDHSDCYSNEIFEDTSAQTSPIFNKKTDQAISVNRRIDEESTTEGTSDVSDIEQRLRGLENELQKRRDQLNHLRRKKEKEMLKKKEIEMKKELQLLEQQIRQEKKTETSVCPARTQSPRILSPRSSLEAPEKNFSDKDSRRSLNFDQDINNGNKIDQRESFSKNLHSNSVHNDSTKMSSKLTDSILSNQSINEMVWDVETREFDSSAIEKSENSENTNKSIVKSLSENTSRSVEKSISENTNRSVEKGVSKIINKGVEKSISENTNKSIEKSISESTNKSVEKSISESTNKTIEKSISDNTNKIIEKSISENTNKSVEKSISENTNKSIEKSISENTNKSVKKSISEISNKSIEKSISENISNTIEKSISENTNKTIEKSLDGYSARPIPTGAKENEYYDDIFELSLKSSNGNSYEHLSSISKKLNDSLGVKPLETTNLINNKHDHSVMSDKSKSSRSDFYQKSEKENFNVSNASEKKGETTVSSYVFNLNDRVIVEGRLKGTVMYIGKISNSDLTVAGVMLDEPNGTSNGTFNGHKYFDCRQNYGLFIKVENLEKISDLVSKTIVEKDIIENIDNFHNSDTHLPSSIPKSFIEEDTTEKLSDITDFKSSETHSRTNTPDVESADELSEHKNHISETSFKLLQKSSEIIKFDYISSGHLSQKDDMSVESCSSKSVHKSDVNRSNESNRSLNISESTSVKSQIINKLNEVDNSLSINGFTSVKYLFNESDLTNCVKTVDKQSYNQSINISHKPEIHSDTVDHIVNSLLKSLLTETVNISKGRAMRVNKSESIETRAMHDKSESIKTNIITELAMKTLLNDAISHMINVKKCKSYSLKTIPDDFVSLRVQDPANTTIQYPTIQDPTKHISLTQNHPDVTEKIKNLKTVHDELDALLKDSDSAGDSDTDSEEEIRSSNIILPPRGFDSEEPVMSIPYTEIETKDLVLAALKEIENLSLDEMMVTQPSNNFFTKIKDNHDRNSILYCQLVFDVSKSLYHDIILFRQDHRQNHPLLFQIRRKNYSKFTRTTNQLVDENEIRSAVCAHVCTILGLKPGRPSLEKLKHKLPLNLAKKDYVDAILVEELREEEIQWVNYDEDELRVKFQLADAILENLLYEITIILSSV